MPEPKKPSRRTLDRISARVTTFLHAIARYPIIATILATRGYRPEVHEYAWSRLAKLGALPKPAKTTSEQDVQDAFVELDDWDESNFDIMRAVLAFNAPTVVDDLFRDLTAQQGPKAAAGVGTLLGRLDAMENGRPDEVAAVAVLAQHGYSKQERARLRALVDLTQALSPAPVVSDAEREKILAELYAWHTMWSTIARNVITRRQHLISLGIAARRTGAPLEEEGEEEGEKETEEGDEKEADTSEGAKPPVGDKPAPADGKATPADGKASPVDGPAAPVNPK